MRFGSNSPGALRKAHKIGDGLGRMVSEQGDLDVAAVSVQRGGSGRKGLLVTESQSAITPGRAPPGARNTNPHAAHRNEPADGPVMAVCEGT